MILKLPMQAVSEALKKVHQVEIVSPKSRDGAENAQF